MPLAGRAQKGWERNSVSFYYTHPDLNANKYHGGKHEMSKKIYNAIMDLSQTLKDHPEKTRAVALLQQEIE